MGMADKGWCWNRGLWFARRTMSCMRGELVFIVARSKSAMPADGTKAINYNFDADFLNLAFLLLLTTSRVGEPLP